MDIQDRRDRIQELSGLMRLKEKPLPYFQFDETVKDEEKQEIKKALALLNRTIVGRHVLSYKAEIFPCTIRVLPKTYPLFRFIDEKPYILLPSCLCQKGINSSFLARALFHEYQHYRQPRISKLAKRGLSLKEYYGITLLKELETFVNDYRIDFELRLIGEQTIPCKAQILYQRAILDEYDKALKSEMIKKAPILGQRYFLAYNIAVDKVATEKIISTLQKDPQHPLYSASKSWNDVYKKQFEDNTKIYCPFAVGKGNPRAYEFWVKKFLEGMGCHSNRLLAFTKEEIKKDFDLQSYEKKQELPASTELLKAISRGNEKG